MKRKVCTLLMALVLCLGLCCPAYASAFTDVAEDAYYADAVAWAVERHITTGATATTFEPDRPCTEAEILTFIHNYMGKPKAASPAAIPGVTPGSFYADAVAWAWEKGIAGGTFNEGTPCTRSRMAEYLWKLAGSLPAGSSGFSDVPADAAYAQAVSWAVKMGLTTGTGGTSFSPDEICSRGQIITFLYRFDRLGLTAKVPGDSAGDKPDLEARSRELDQIVAEAKRQFGADDHTPLSEPVPYKVLWLGYTHVTYGELDFQMTASDREYLKATALNFEKVVEEYAGHNIDISVELYFMDRTVPLTRADNADWLYLAKSTTQADIDTYTERAYYDTVITTVQTAGSENVQRNQGKAGYGVHEVMTGLKTHGMEHPMGYSTFDLGRPAPGTYPLEDPKIPSLYATAVAIHEWLHQLEYLGVLLGIEYPNTHAYMGPEVYPGYQKVVSGQDNYDFCEFYKDVLGGTVSYTDRSGTRNVGIYPAMWRLIRRDALNIGSFALKNGSGGLYLTAQETEPTVTVGAQPSKWYLRYGGTKGYVLVPETDPDKQLTLSNAWDSEGNNLHMFWANPGYPEAQLWQFTKNADGTYCIRTSYSSGRAVTAAKPGAAVVIKAATSPDEAQTWTLE